MSSTSSSSTSNTPQQQCHLSISNEEDKASTEPESDEDILIKQMIERAMKLTQQGDTRHAQHLLGIIHEKLSNKRKRAAAEAAANSNDNEKLKISPSNDFHSFSSLSNEDSQSSNNIKISPSSSEHSVRIKVNGYIKYFYTVNFLFIRMIIKIHLIFHIQLHLLFHLHRHHHHYKMKLERYHLHR